MNPKQPPTFEYDEFQSVGRDYSRQSEVDIYDASHADFRDIVAESDRVLDELGISATDRLIDFGAGTGTFAVQAAQRCQWVDAVDVSQAMLARAQTKAAQAQLTNLAFHHAGFLTYEHSGPLVEAVTTTFAFHHLPDFWKGIALGRIRDMMQPGGQLYIHDVVLTPENALDNIRAFIHQ
ncbi:class I SAM-dependent methyltransferase [Trichothermofontia sp.]